MPGGHRRARRRGNVGPTGLPRTEARRLVERRCARRTEGHPRASTRLLQRRRLAPPLIHKPGRARALRNVATNHGCAALLEQGATRDRPGTPASRASDSRLWPGPERPSPAPPCCRGHGGDQTAPLERAQRDVQRPRSEPELGRELRGRDGARVASRDHIEHRLLARGEVVDGIGEVVDGIARQSSP